MKNLAEIRTNVLENPTPHLKAAYANGKLDGAREMADVLLNLLASHLPARTLGAFSRIVERQIDSLEKAHLRAIDVLVVNAQAKLRRGRR